MSGNGKSARLIRLRRPSENEITACLASSDLPFSYSEVGATKGLGGSRPERLSSYDVDRHSFAMGTGRELFERARESLLRWRHLEIPWLEFYGGSAPAQTGQVVATLISVAGLWFLNPCRVVYTHVSRGEADCAAFAYGTLHGHAECGEERFEVSFNASTGEVKYQIVAFSRPAILLSKLGYPVARRLQRRFADASAKSLSRAAA